MHLTIEIQTQQDMQLILQYLKLLPNVRILPGQAGEDIKIGQSVRKENPSLDFSRYWGSIKTSMSIEEIDNTIRKMRSEWERDTY
jgi:uncharacterized protein YeeX (DUF496 family)